MSRKTLDWKVLLTFIGMFGIAFYFWDTFAIYPFKALLVMFHEIGHHTGAFLTGGHLGAINLFPQLGGESWSGQGIEWIVISSGYLGSLFFGALIMVLAARTHLDKIIAFTLGVALVVITALYVRTFFGWIIGLGFGGVLIFSGLKLPEKVNDFLLKFIGVTSCMYANIDIMQDLIFRTVKGSDAYAMSEAYFGPPIMWGIFYMALSTAGTILAVKWSIIKTVGPEEEDEETEGEGEPDEFMDYLKEE